MQWALDHDRFVKAERLREFAARCRELYPDPCEAHKQLERLIYFAEEYQKAFEGLHDVFHDVDYRDSGDYGDDQVIPTIKWWPHKPPACTECGTIGLSVGDPCRYSTVSHARWNSKNGTSVEGPCTGTVQR